MTFTFYQLVRTPAGYLLAPYITVYPGMVEINRYV